jgi:hypothetical protein
MVLLLLLGCLLLEAQYFSTLQPILHVKRALLLLFPECAFLLFPHRPSAQSGDFNQPLTVYVDNYTSGCGRGQLPQNKRVFD